MGSNIKAIRGGIGSFWNFDIIYIPSESHMSLVFKMPNIFQIGSVVHKSYGEKRRGGYDGQNPNSLFFYISKIDPKMG